MTFIIDSQGSGQPSQLTDVIGLDLETLDFLLHQPQVDQTPLPLARVRQIVSSASIPMDLLYC